MLDHDRPRRDEPVKVLASQLRSRGLDRFAEEVAGGEAEVSVLE
jgi:hypothetical protein